MSDQADNASARAPRGRDRVRRHLRLWLGRGITALVIAGVAAALVAGALPKPVGVDLGKVRRGALRITVNDDGRARVKDRYVIGSPLTGNLARVELHPGDLVKKGQVLLRLLPLDAPLLDARSRAEAEARLAAALAAQRQAQAAVGRAQAEADYARSEAEKSERLAARGAVSAQARDRSQVEARTRMEELASAQFGVKVADHQAEVARAALARLQGGARGEPFAVASPVDGRVLRVQQQSGGVVTAGAALLELGDPASLEMVVDVLTQDATQISAGAPAIIENWGGPALKAHVRLVEPSAFTRLSALGVEEQRVNVVLDLDEPRERWAALGDGYRVECRVVVWEGADVLAVPLGAVFRDGERWAVFTVVGGKAAVRPVVLGRRGDQEIELREGLREGEALILHPSDQVKAGVAIEPRSSLRGSNRSAL